MLDSRKAVRLVVVVALASLPLAVYARGGATQCTDIPISMTVVPAAGMQLPNGTALPDGTTQLPPYGTVLTGDTKSNVYTTGQDGLTFTRINICGSTPTYDATTSLGGSTRTMTVSFPAPIAYSLLNGAQAPVWAGSTFGIKPILYVRNILWGRMNGQYTFTTRFILKQIVGPGDKAVYDLRMQPTTQDAMNLEIPYADTNLPQETSPVTVQDLPGTCRTDPNGTLDSWVVTLNSPYVGTLYKQARGGAYVHSGQYATPLRLFVQAQSCVPASLTH